MNMGGGPLNRRRDIENKGMNDMNAAILKQLKASMGESKDPFFNILDMLDRG
jgi:hypothetical protein